MTDINARDKEGRTPLMHAARWGHTDIVIALVDKGADVNIKDEGGNTALMVATKGRYIEIVTLLKAAGATQ